jgi:hypothetical protein
MSRGFISSNRELRDLSPIFLRRAFAYSSLDSLKSNSNAFIESTIFWAVVVFTPTTIIVYGISIYISKVLSF